MDFKKMAEENKIIEYKSGSHMYGLATPTSDEDYMGIFMPNKELVLGFRECDEVDLSFKDKLDNGKNSKDAIDRKLYNYKKFIKLAKQNNPNILECLFVNEKDIVYINDFGRRLLDNKNLFPYKGLKSRFIGYAISQKKKMYIKRDNFLALENAESILLKFYDDGNSKMLLPLCENYKEFTDIFKSKYKTDEHYKIGERKLVKNQTVKKALQEIRKLIGEASNRKELIKDKGFDCFTEDTQFLTLNGWKYYDEVCDQDKLGTINQDDTISYQNYSNRVKKHLDGFVYEHANLYTNFCVTENHRLLISNAHRNHTNNYSTRYDEITCNWEYKTLKQINNSRRSNFHVKNSIINKNKDFNISDEFLILIGLYVSDGTINFRDKEKLKPRSIRLTQTENGKELYHKLCESISNKYNLKKYTYRREDRNNSENYYILNDKKTCGKILELCNHGSKNKKLPYFINELSKRQCDLLIDAMWAGDGSIKNSKNNVYYTSSKFLSDDFQRLCFFAGRDVNLYDYCGRYDSNFMEKEKNNIYQISYSKEVGIPKIIRINHNIKKRKRRQDSKYLDNTGGNKIKYNGNVVCFEVPNSNLITRRKGKIAIQGNCKFGSHLIRLLCEGIELMENGTLEFPLKNKKEILEIKTGLWSLDDVIAYSKELEDKFNLVHKNSSLPGKPQDDKIEKFMMDELERYLF